MLHGPDFFNMDTRHIKNIDSISILINNSNGLKAFIDNFALTQKLI